MSIWDRIQACTNAVSLAEAPKILIENAESLLRMSQTNGTPRDRISPQKQRDSSLRGSAAPTVRTGMVHCLLHSHEDALMPVSGLRAFSSETLSSPEPQPWSSAVGHASTGKSGRVIERLQGDIDRLHREKQLLKVQHEEALKTNEALQSQNQSLKDRNSNYEQSHESNTRQLARKERQVEELREELRREKQRTSAAERLAQAAAANEESWRDAASQARSLGAQKEVEYETIVTCRRLDNDRHQGSVDKMQANFDMLVRQRMEDQDSQRKLEIIAEQQKQTISQLEELNKKLNSNFKAYRSEIDIATAALRDLVSGNDDAVNAKLDEMTRVTGEMRWVIGMEHINQEQANTEAVQKDSKPNPEKTPERRSERSPERSPERSSEKASSKKSPRKIFRKGTR